MQRNVPAEKARAIAVQAPAEAGPIPAVPIQNSDDAGRDHERENPGSPGAPIPAGHPIEPWRGDRSASAGLCTSVAMKTPRPAPPAPLPTR